MLRVFLAEDESIIREMLRDTMPWKQCGYTFVGEAGDGEMALPLIRQTRPDVLITDIRMPFMDGLELSRRVLQEFPQMKIVIISGYDDFEFARQAISIGVERYLLKPVTKTMLVNVLSEIRTRIEAEQTGIPEDETAAELPPMKDAKQNLMELDLSRISPKGILDVLHSADARQIAAFSETFAESIADYLHYAPFCQYILLSIRFTATEFVQSLGFQAQSLLEHLECMSMIGREIDAGQLRQYTQEILLRAIGLRDQIAKDPHPSLLKEALRHIDANFKSPELSLNAVAKAVNVSANYLSAVFSQEMHMTFVEYLTAKRMEKARELLLTTDLRSGEIAFSVGYKDPHYFSFLFKKTQGCTPRDYRAGKDRK